MPQMLGDIVVQLLKTLPDVDLVGWATADDDPLDTALMRQADLLIVREADGALRSILAQPRLSVLQISRDGQAGALVRFAQHRMALDRASIGKIVDLIDSSVGGHA